MKLEQALQIALQHHQAGRFTEAEGIYRQILAQQPNYHPALHLLGVLAHQVNQNDVALDLIRRAVQLSPATAEYPSNLAMVLSALGRYQEAADSARSALRLRPEFADAQVNLGYALALLGESDQAISAFREAIRIAPDNAQAHGNLARTLQRNGMLAEAIAAFGRAISLQPGRADLHNGLGLTLESEGRISEALDAFRAAIRCNPRFTDAHNNLALAFHAKHRFDEAISAYRDALSLKPSNPRILNNLGNALRETGDLAGAIATLRLAADLSAIDPTPHSNLIYSMHYQPGVDQHALRAEEQRWSLKYAAPIKPLIKPHTNLRDPDRKLRIGYVSPDFRDHCQSFFTLPLLRNRDRGRFEVTCYSNVFRPDAVTAQIQQQVDHWRDISILSDQQAADLVRADHIDILIDLTLHMSANRLLLFAHKPAPVQASWLGYPGSTGLETIDYRVSDPYLDPPGMDESVCAEQTIRLSNAFWCYAPPSEEPAVGQLPANRNGHITFGCLNSFYKINDEVLALWSEVLKKVSTSRMLILADEGKHRTRMLEAISSMGIDPSRITFEVECPRTAYLDLYNRVDISLDTFPYNGHTTTLDSLWMGVPVVTFPGSMAVSRGSFSILQNVGLTELIGSGREQYVTIAAELANNPEKLSTIRSALRERLRASPLMDAARFTKDFEEKLHQMWRCWCTR